MKRVLACVLALTLALGMTPVAFGASTNPGVTAEIKKSGSTITVTVKMPAVTKLTACVVSVQFDPDVVSVSDEESGYAATYIPTGETDPVAYFSGEHTGGFAVGRDDLVKDAYMNGGGVTKASVTPFAVFTFTVVDDTAETADFTVTLEQFYSDGVTIADGDGMTVLEKSVALASDTTTTTTTTSDEDTAEDLAQQIKDAISGIGLDSLLEDDTISGMIEQFADLFGDGYSSDDFIAILDSIIGGDSGDFSFDEITSFFTDLYNQILELLGISTSTTTKTTTTTSATTDTDTDTEETTDTSNADNGGNSAGDAGIALAVTVCLAAAAAFVISRKKED